MIVCTFRVARSRSLCLEAGRENDCLAFLGSSAFKTRTVKETSADDEKTQITPEFGLVRVETGGCVGKLTANNISSHGE